MFQAIQSYLPEEWRSAFEFLAGPLLWIPEWQAILIAYVISDSSVGVLMAKGVFILLPACLLVVGMWSTMIGLYTIPFRSDRGRFMTTMLLAWWDAGRSTWLFWAGIFRFGVVLVGWIWGLIRFGWRMLVNVVRSALLSPMRFADWSTRHYFQPGVPWLAFLLTLGWSALEATIFTFTLSPTLQEVLAGITGMMPNPAFMLPVLWIFLFFLIAGSFACLQVLSEAVRSRDTMRIVEMAFVELFVMFFEVVFLYRELIDAVTPWVAQQTGGQVLLGLWSTLAIASFGWVGIRGMTWFLFGRFGTPALLAVLSREHMEGREGGEAGMALPPAEDIWKEPIAALKAESEWFRAEATRGFELITLPVLQLFAAAVNFPVVVLQAEPVFRLPLSSLDEVLAVTPFPRRRESGWKAERVPLAPSTPAAEGGEIR